MTHIDEATERAVHKALGGGRMEMDAPEYRRMRMMAPQTPNAAENAKLEARTLIGLLRVYVYSVAGGPKISDGDYVKGVSLSFEDALTRAEDACFDSSFGTAFKIENTAWETELDIFKHWYLKDKKRARKVWAVVEELPLHPGKLGDHI